MSRPAATPLLDRLAELDAELGQARRRLSERLEARTASVRRIEEARGPLLAYFEALGAGERQEDPAEERRLLAAVSEAGAHVRMDVMADARSGVPMLVAVDERAERLVHGAQRAVANAEQAVAAFLQDQRDGLAAELGEQARASRAAIETAVPALAAATAEDRRVRAGWRRLLRENDLENTLPPDPLRGWDDELVAGGGVPLAVPAQFLAAADEPAAA